MRRRRIAPALRLPARLRLGTPIRDARRAAKLTQDELGRRLGLKGRAIYRWERNETAPSNTHRRALVREVNLFNPEAALKLQSVFSERTGKTYNVIATGAPQASVPQKPIYKTSTLSNSPYLDELPWSGAVSVSAQPTSDVLDVALLKLADELDVPPRRARRALGRMLERLQNSKFRLESIQWELERLLARD